MHNTLLWASWASSRWTAPILLYCAVCHFFHVSLLFNKKSHKIQAFSQFQLILYIFSVPQSFLSWTNAGKFRINLLNTYKKNTNPNSDILFHGEWSQGLDLLKNTDSPVVKKQLNLTYIVIGLSKSRSGQRHQVRPPPAQQWVIVKRWVTRNRRGVRVSLQKPAQPDLKSLESTKSGDFCGYSIPKLCSSDCEGVVVIRPHRALCPVVNRGDDCLDSQSRVNLEHHFDIIWGVAIEYFPDLDDTISLPPPLQGHYSELLDSIPVVELPTSCYSSQEWPLDILQLLDISHLGGVPEWTAVL